MKASTLDLLAERIADLVTERIATLLADRERGPDALIDAAEVGQRFGVSRGWVYENAEALGAITLGTGDRPRLRFDPTVVYERLAARPAPAAAPTRRTPRRRQTDPDLLPIRGGAS